MTKTRLSTGIALLGGRRRGQNLEAMMRGRNHQPRQEELRRGRNPLGRILGQ